MMIPFSPPKITNEIIRAVEEVLRSGWITTGPKTKEFERRLTEYCGCKSTLCLNSATAGLEIMLRWFGVEKGDEVIVPAYTYSATANVVVHCGAKVIFVDTNKNDFNISIEQIEKAITKHTKVIMPVDFAGLPCDYDAINALVKRKDIQKKFTAKTKEQKQLKRILVLSDAAHSIGAIYKGKKAGCLTDVSVFSFHAVKNLITAEGGAVCLNLPTPFNNEEIYKQLCIKTLHGQNKDALAKTQKGAWRYDIIEAGFKCNMTDIAAAIGLSELAVYDSDTLKKRKEICDIYSNAFSKYDWAELPVMRDENRESCYHLYPLRIKGIKEKQRDEIIKEIFERNVSVNVHFIPVPMMSYYKKNGYKISNYKTAYNNYAREISLPVYYNLSSEQISQVIEAVASSVKKVLG
ncbi:MAG TPA: DegT/DnrJ/EryC1/StrS family aminotransferase [Bacteroidia bacterium]|nr:DegT/DnrJ/EryC1/StrS family aminotransferase [Bacteroidia bacterium]